SATVTDEKIVISAVASDSRAKIEGDIGEKKLSLGVNTFSIKVISERGNTREYYIYVTRNKAAESVVTPLSNDISLKKLVLSTGEIKLEKDNYLYSVDVPYKIKEVLNFLQENVYTKLTVRDIANHFGKSESAIKQLFNQYHKNGIIKYFNELKIKEAKSLIRECVYNFTQISEILGFDNPQYFSKVFKSFAKMTPKEYKQSIFKKQ
ncbi:MAG: helix-turn-helix domain-containing protein, partial [Ruminococcaceae bacterium]|nr:helix-turn-helix domain-containing protein [Oscillospiraceae bacterium]